MFHITCLDENGEVLSGFTQWDINRTIHVNNYKYDFAPMFHFCNKFSKKSLGVKSVLSNGKLSVDVPNELLREPCPIIAYVFLSENGTGKTLQTIHLPVRPKVQPSDYEYVDNIRVVYLEDLIAEVQELLEDPKVISQAVSDWLDAHPEATTTVGDGTITEAKLDGELKKNLSNKVGWAKVTGSTLYLYADKAMTSLIQTVTLPSGGSGGGSADGNTTYTFAISGNVITVTDSDGGRQTITLPSAVTDSHINSLIDAKLGVIENGTY